MELARRILAIAWILLVATALIGHLAHLPLATLSAWFLGLVLVPFTGALGRAARDERLERPVIYRAAAAVAFVLPLAGALLVEVPRASGECTLFAPYFVVMAVLGYRMVVARGPLRVLRTMVASLLLWPPLAVFMFMGCRLHGWVPPQPPWTELATEHLLFLTQLVNAALCAIALVTFAPRNELVPEARVLA